MWNIVEYRFVEYSKPQNGRESIFCINFIYKYELKVLKNISK